MNKIIYDDYKSKFSMEELYFIGGYITYETKVSTNGFSGVCNFCVSESDVKNIIGAIDLMLETLNGEIIINDSESNAFLRVHFENLQDIFVSGQIGGDHRDNILRFKFKVDQTFLHNIKNALLDY